MSFRLMQLLVILKKGATEKGGNLIKQMLKMLSVMALVVLLVGLQALSGCTTAKKSTPPAGGRLLFEDDFSDPSSGWFKETEEESERDYKDGEYHFMVKKSYWSTFAWNQDAGIFRDFLLEVDGRLISKSNKSLYGLIFRLKDSRNFYRFIVSGDGYYLVGARLNGNWKMLQSKTRSTHIRQGNSINHLTIVCEGSKIDAYVNDHHLTTMRDNSIAKGLVGMIVDKPEAVQPTTHTAFDNMRLYSLN